MAYINDMTMDDATSTPERVLSFERCFNFRDLGGYIGRERRAVRWRRLFRSMTPQYMSEADREAAAALGIGLVVDFRGAHYESYGLVEAAGCTRLPLSPQFVQQADAEYERFRNAPPEEALPKLLETYSEQFAAAMRAMAAQPEMPVLFHCRLGKDRTGVFSALVLKLLGVNDDDVLQDYLLTGQHESSCRQLLATTEPDESLTNREPLVAKQAPSRAAMTGVLERLVSQHGGAYGFFRRHGLESDALDAFIDAALQPRDGVCQESAGAAGYVPR